MDGTDPTSSSASSSRPLREYYLALGSEPSSLDTLCELIIALAPDDRLTTTDASSLASVSVVVCVSARDLLDEVVTGISAVRCSKHNLRINLWSLHSDMLEREVTTYANEFREVARSRVTGGQREEDHREDGADEDTEPGVRAPPPFIVNVLVTTDSPLKALSKLNSDPLAPTLLIHYSLPRRREEYARRKSVVLGSRKSSNSSRVAVCFVHAGRIDELHEFEAMADRKLLEMPVHVSEMFSQ